MNLRDVQNNESILNMTIRVSKISIDKVCLPINFLITLLKQDLEPVAKFCSNTNSNEIIKLVTILKHCVEPKEERKL